MQGKCSKINHFHCIFSKNSLTSINVHRVFLKRIFVEDEWIEIVVIQHGIEIWPSNENALSNLLFSAKRQSAIRTLVHSTRTCLLSRRSSPLFSIIDHFHAPQTDKVAQIFVECLKNMDQHKEKLLLINQNQFSATCNRIWKNFCKSIFHLIIRNKLY